MPTKQWRLRPQDEQRLQNLRLMDDDFMTMVFDNNIEATELLLNVFFDRYDMKVLRVASQREIKNPNGRSVRLDIYALDADGRHYDIEIQRQDSGAGERRARFNSSMMDTKLLQVGQKLDELPDSYVIFITEHDVRRQGRPIHRFHRRDDETGELFDDGSHIIYVNGAYQNECSRIGQLMHDFRCTSPQEMHHRVLADRVHYFKETEGGRAQMCKIMEDVRNEGIQEGRLEGRLEGRILERIQIMRSLYKNGTGVEEIARLLSMPAEEVQALLAAEPE